MCTGGLYWEVEVEKGLLGGICHVSARAIVSEF